MTTKNPELGPPPSPNRKEHPYIGTLRWGELTFDIENERGGYREGKGWRVKMPAHYGEVRGCVSKLDGDPVDVFVGDTLDAPYVYVVHQKHPGTQVVDEDKVMVGFPSAAAAEKTYRKAYDQGGFWQGMTRWSAMEWHDLMRDSDTVGRLDRPRSVRERLQKAPMAWPLLPLSKDAQVKAHTRQGRPVRAHTRHVQPHHGQGTLGAADEKVQEVANFLVSMMESGGGDLLTWPHDTTGISRDVLHVTDAKGRELAFRVALAPTYPDEKGMGGAIGTNSRGETVLVARVPVGMRLSAEAWATQLRDTVAHELVHLIDPTPRSSGAAPSTEAGLEAHRQAYYNDRHEVTAYRHEVFRDLNAPIAARMIRGMREADAATRSGPDAEAAAEMDLLTTFGADMTSWMRLASPTWRTVGPYLEPSNRRRFLKMAATLAQQHVEGSSTPMKKARVKGHLRNVGGRMVRVREHQRGGARAVQKVPWRMLKVPVGAKLYHGTPGGFDPDEVGGGGYDGVLWTGSQDIARLYIPTNGLSVGIQNRDMQQASNDPMTVAVQEAIGISYDNIKVDDYGRISSFTSNWDNLPDEAFEWAEHNGRRWKTGLDPAWVATRMKEAGLWAPDAPEGRFQGGLVSMATHKRPDGSYHYTPLRHDHRDEGEVIELTTTEPLLLADIAQEKGGESSLMDLDYHRLDDFRRLRAMGYDGVRITDFAQSNEQGNVSHLSVGLFPRGIAKTTKKSEPATYTPLGEGPEARGEAKADDAFHYMRKARVLLPLLKADQLGLFGDVQAHTRQDSKTGAVTPVRRHQRRRAPAQMSLHPRERDSVTTARYVEPDGMVDLTFQRGEPVDVWLSRGRYFSGVITGISHAENTVKVDGVEVEIDRVYKAGTAAKRSQRSRLDAMIRHLAASLDMHDRIGLAREGIDKEIDTLEAMGATEPDVRVEVWVARQVLERGFEARDDIRHEARNLHHLAAVRRMGHRYEHDDSSGKLVPAPDEVYHDPLITPGVWDQLDPVGVLTVKGVGPVATRQLDEHQLVIQVADTPSGLLVVPWGAVDLDATEEMMQKAEQLSLFADVQGHGRTTSRGQRVQVRPHQRKRAPTTTTTVEPSSHEPEPTPAFDLEAWRAEHVRGPDHEGGLEWASGEWWTALDHDPHKGFAHIVRGWADPERLSRKERHERLGVEVATTVWRTHRSWSVDDWRTALSKVAARGRPFTFNEAVLHATDYQTTADSVYQSNADRALWDMVADGEIENTLGGNTLWFRSTAPSPNRALESVLTRGAALIAEADHLIEIPADDRHPNQAARLQELIRGGENNSGLTGAIRREAWALGIRNLDQAVKDRTPPRRPIAKVRRELEKTRAKMARLHTRAATRAQATTREAKLGRLGDRVDALEREIAHAERFAAWLREG